MPDTFRRIAFFLLCLLAPLIAVTRAGADIAGCLIALLFILYSAGKKEWKWTKAPEMRVLALLWLFMMISASFTPFSFKEAFMTSLLWGRFVLLYAGIRYWLLTDRRSLEVMAKIAAVALVLVAIDAGWQYLTGTSLSGQPMIPGDRLTGPLHTANVGGYLFRIGFPVAGLVLYRLLEAGRRRGAWLAGVLVLGVVTMVILSGERSSALLMLVGLGMAGLTLFISRPRLRLFVLAGGIGMAALLAGLIATQPSVQDRAHEFARQVERFWPTPYGQMYIAAFNLAAMHPLTGVGAREFMPACSSIMQSHSIGYCDIHPHNTYMEWLEAGGVPGLVLFVLAMACLARQLPREATYDGTGIVLAAAAYGGFAALVFPFAVTQSGFANWAGVLFWYSLALVMSIHRMRQADG